MLDRHERSLLHAGLAPVPCHRRRRQWTALRACQSSTPKCRAPSSARQEPPPPRRRHASRRLDRLVEVLV